MYRNMRYVVDLRHPLQAPCGGDGSSGGGHEKTYIQSSRPWECGNPEGISKECGKGGKPASWLYMLSILCHFHGLLFALQMLDKPIMPPPSAICRTRHEMLIGTDRLSLSALSIYHSSSGRLRGKCIQFIRQAGYTSTRNRADR